MLIIEGVENLKEPAAYIIKNEILQCLCDSTCAPTVFDYSPTDFLMLGQTL